MLSIKESNKITHMICRKEAIEVTGGIFWFFELCILLLCVSTHFRIIFYMKENIGILDNSRLYINPLIALEE